MKLRYLAILTAGLLVAANTPRPAPSGPDYDKLQGGWRLVSVEVNGQPLAVDQLTEARLKVQGGTVRLPAGEDRAGDDLPAAPGPAAEGD
jgi:hypothetical protein